MAKVTGNSASVASMKRLDADVREETWTNRAYRLLLSEGHKTEDEQRGPVHRDCGDEKKTKRCRFVGVGFVCKND